MSHAFDRTMRVVQLLDCTLRDGGYCNQWSFGNSNIKKIINGLTDSGIDIIECGFISDKDSYNRDNTVFSTVEDISPLLPDARESLYVAMINYGEYNVNELPNCSDETIDGIRLAFHKKDLIPALELCKQIKNKGYKLFIQAMVTISYSDVEFLELIKKVNEIEPYAFYIVDSFGMMKKRDLIRFFSLADNNLDDNIIIGFHSHNNLQLAYSNALALIDAHNRRNIIIDTTIYGMGRGAGNLNTELFIDHMNTEFDTGYDLKPILSIMDGIIGDFYQRNPWGYSLPNYLSAVHCAHPNYAKYLSERSTLTVEMMDDIFDHMDSEKKNVFDKQYIKDLYMEYMDVKEVRKQHYEDFCNLVSNRTILLIGPGKSSINESEKIREFSNDENVITISINHSYSELVPDFIFVSNNIRFKELPFDDRKKCIITSNIPDTKAYLQMRYRDLINDNEFVRDNAGLMATKMMMVCGAKRVVLAGFDGYSYDILDNYAEGQRILVTKKATIDAINQGMSAVFKELSKEIELEFLTKPLYYSV